MARILHSVIVVILSFSFAESNAQLYPNSDFEQGDTTKCHCPDGYTCYNDAGRAVDGIHRLFNVGAGGCIGSRTAFTNPLGAHSGKGYLYFYAGGDKIATEEIEFEGGEKIELCVWYAGTQGGGDFGQNLIDSHFKFGIDGVEVGPHVPVPVDTKWTQHCYTVTMTPGKHRFNILSGWMAAYSLWFDDFTISGSCKEPVVDLGKDTVLCPEDVLSINISNVNASYLWQDGYSDSVRLINSVGKYWATVSNLCGTSSDTLVVTRKDCSEILEIPNVFTPNDDGLNDRFKPSKMNSIKNGTLEVYNRWGTRVYQTDDLMEGWDGRTKGEPCPDGTYFWIIRCQTKYNNVIQQRGSLTLVR